MASLTTALSEADERVLQLEQSVEQLLSNTQALRHKLNASQATVADLEQGRLQDGQRLTATAEELEHWQERYKTDTVSCV